jgi:hypothetical protein
MGGIAIGSRKAREPNGLPLTFVAIGALFGIKFIGWHAEDIVALDAHSVEYFRGGSSQLFASCRIAWGFAGVHR